MSVTLTLGLSGPDLPTLFTALAATQMAGRGLPERVSVDYKERKPKRSWLADALSAMRRRVMVFWDSESGWLSFEKDRLIKLERAGLELDPEALLSVLSELPFTYASAASLYPEWENGALGQEYWA